MGQRKKAKAIEWKRYYWMCICVYILCVLVSQTSQSWTADIQFCLQSLSGFDMRLHKAEEDEKREIYWEKTEGWWAVLYHMLAVIRVSWLVNLVTFQCMDPNKTSNDSRNNLKWHYCLIPGDYNWRFWLFRLSVIEENTTKDKYSRACVWYEVCYQNQCFGNYSYRAQNALVVNTVRFYHTRTSE